MFRKNKLIGAGIVLSAIGYIGYLAAEHVVDSVRREARKLEEEKAQALENEEKEEAGRTDDAIQYENADQPAG